MKTLLIWLAATPSLAGTLEFAGALANARTPVTVNGLEILPPDPVDAFDYGYQWGRSAAMDEASGLLAIGSPEVYGTGAVWLYDYATGVLVDELRPETFLRGGRVSPRLGFAVDIAGGYVAAGAPYGGSEGSGGFLGEGAVVVWDTSGNVLLEHLDEESQTPDTTIGSDIWLAGGTVNTTVVDWSDWRLEGPYTGPVMSLAFAVPEPSGWLAACLAVAGFNSRWGRR